MDTKKLVSPKLAHAAEAMLAPAPKTEEQVLVETMTDQEKRERAVLVWRKLEKLIWHDPRNLDGKTLPLDWREPISDSGSHGSRSVDASPWIDIDTFNDGRVVQTQLQTWRDQIDYYGEHGGRLDVSSAEQRPQPSMWLRVRNAADTAATESEEVFRLPASEVVMFRGERMAGDPELWDRLDQLVADIAGWRGKD